MLKSLILTVTILLMSVSGGLAESLPRIEMPAPVYDFGEVMQGESVVHTFAFKNAGDALLVIDRVQSTCGCTGVLLSDKNIPAGETGTIKATFDSSRFRGQVQKNILLYSNNPGTNPLTFTVKGKVREPLGVNPARLVFGQVAVGQTKTVTAVLTNNSGRSLKLVNLRTSNVDFRAEVDDAALEDQETTLLKVIAEPNAKTSHLSGNVLIRLDRAGLREVRIPVSGAVVPSEPPGQ